MTDKTLTELSENPATTATSISNDDLFYVVQSGVSKSVAPPVMQALIANPPSDDGLALGETTTPLRWSDLNLASGGVINWNSGDVTVTHAANALTVAGGEFTATTTTSGGTTGRTLQAHFADHVSVKDFGALGDGVTDDLTAFNAALAASTHVFMPPGTYIINGTINITQTNTRLHGAGRGATVLTGTSNAAPVIAVATNLVNVNIAHVWIDRTGSPTGTAHGISVAESTASTLIEDVTVTNQGGWGLALGPTSYGSIRDSIITKNLTGGVLVTATATSGVLQWELHNILSQQNGGAGFQFQSVAGPTQVTLGNLTKLTTYGNTGRGIAFIGTAGVPMYGVRLYDSFFGSDADSEVYLNTYARGHLLSNISTELAGSAATGPTLATAASHIGYGFEFTANNTEIQLVNAKGDNHSLDGLRSSATNVGVIGSAFTNCGNALVAGSQSGATFDAGTDIRFSGNKCGNISGGTTITSGLVAGSSVTDFVATDNDLTNSGTPLTTSATGTQFLKNNLAATQLDQVVTSIAANTSGDGLSLINPTAATAGNQRYSPRLRLTGKGWKTDATAASQTVDWKIETQPIQAAANPDNSLVFDSQINGGGYNNRMKLLDTASTTTELRLSNAQVSELTLYAGGAQQGLLYASAAQMFFGAVTNIPIDFIIANASVARLTGTVFSPATSGAVDLGSTTLPWGSLHLKSGGVINFNNGNATVTHSSGLLTVAGAGLKLLVGTNTIAPLKFQAGTNLTTAEDGAMEFDGQSLFFSPDASDRRIIPTVAITRINADNTLSDSTTLQKIFNASASGALTLPVGSYIFECVVGIDAMSATSGNAALSVIGAGGATVTNTLQVVVGIDGAKATAGAAAGASWSLTNDAPAANTSVVTAGTGTEMSIMWKGSFEVTVAGTIIPSVDLITGGVTPAVKIGSYFMCWRMGAATDVTQGNWS
jgi:hypothetical protein